ncbi:MAG: trypsin-like serine protease [Mariniblastus sp.]
MKRSKRIENRTQKTRFDYNTLEPKQMLSANLPSFEAQQFLDHLSSSQETAYLQSDANDLEVVSLREGDDATTALFQQTQNGVPVYDAFLTLHQDSRGQFGDLQGSGFENLNTGSRTPLILNAYAEQVANDSFTDPIKNTVTELTWFTASDDSAKLAWNVNTFLGTNDTETANFSTLVDAFSGDVLQQETPTSVHQLLYNPNTKIGTHERIVINDAIGPIGSQAYAAPFDAVVALALGCTGTLIAPDVVISARHCGAAPGGQILFGDNSNAPDFTATIATAVDPSGPGGLLDGGDFSILTLTADVPSTVATPMRLVDFTDELEGMVAATIGYGLNGVGSSGHEFSSDGFRWGGENIIDIYGAAGGNNSGANIISTDFDDGSNAANTLGSDTTPLEFEATTAPGDSGGPILVQFGSEWVIAGVLSGGTSSTSVYGDISWWTGVAPFRAEIEAVGGVFAEGTVELDQESYIIGETLNAFVEDPGTGIGTVVFTSSSGDVEVVSVTGTSPNFTGSIGTAAGAVNINDGSLQVSFDDVVTVSYGASSDSATIEGITGTIDNDLIEVVVGSSNATVTINGASQTFPLGGGFAIDALGGYDTVTIFDSSSDDVVVMDSNSVSLSGLFTFNATNVEDITTTSGGGDDSVTMTGADTPDIFDSANGKSVLRGNGYRLEANGYDTTKAFGGEGNDRASIDDTIGDDTFYGTTVFANLQSDTGLVINVRDFEKVAAFARNGGNDIATLVGTDGADSLYAVPDYINFTAGNGDLLNAGFFERTTTIGNGGEDTANIYGNENDDTYNSGPYQAYMFGEGYFNQVRNFNNVNAFAGEGGTDKAFLRDSPGEDTFHSTPEFSILFSDQFRSRVKGFANVSAFGTAGYDNATFIDSTGNDRYIARDDRAYLIGDGFLNYATGFNRVNAYSSLGNDVAVLYGSDEDDRFFGGRSQSYIQGANFFSWAGSFNQVTVELGTGGFDTGVFEDSNVDDQFVGNDSRAVLLGEDYIVFTDKLDRVRAISNKGGTDQLSSAEVKYELITIGDWT